MINRIDGITYELIARIMGCVAGKLTEPSELFNFALSCRKFADIIRQRTKDVTRITLYFTQWCPHSKKLLPNWNVFKLVNGSMINNCLVYIREIDCEEYPHSRDPSGSPMQAYPTVIVEKLKQDKWWVVLDNDRTMRSLGVILRTSTLNDRIPYLHPQSGTPLFMPRSGSGA